MILSVHYLIFTFVVQVFGARVPQRQDNVMAGPSSANSDLMPSYHNDEVPLLPREPVNVHLTMNYRHGVPIAKSNSLNAKVNRIVLEAEKSDRDAVCFADFGYEDKLIITSCTDDNPDSVSIRSCNLNEKLFEAAIATLNIDRLNELIAKRKHLLLKFERRVMLLQEAICSVIWSNKSEYKNFGEIFKILLENGFYSRNFDSHPYYHEFESTYVFIRILVHPLLYQPFIDYDKDFFARKKSNYISELIRRSDYDLALTALDLGFDPKIKRSGKDALDEILKPIRFRISEEKQRLRKELTERLRKIVPRP